MVPRTLAAPARNAPPARARGLAAIVLVLASTCSGCHACVALLLADDDESPAQETATRPEAPSEAPAAAASAPTADSPPSAGDERPSAPGTTPTAAASAGDGVDGRYECLQLRVVVGPNFSTKTSFVPGALPGFSITGATYTSGQRQGVVRVDGAIVAFSGGPYDGWRGGLATNSTGFHVRFRGGSPGDPKPGAPTRSGDYQCYRQKGR